MGQEPVQATFGTEDRNFGVFPETMRHFQRAVHDGLVLDDVKDLNFLVSHQEKLQGKYDALVEFGSTARWHMRIPSRFVWRASGCNSQLFNEEFRLFGESRLACQPWKQGWW